MDFEKNEEFIGIELELIDFVRIGYLSIIKVKTSSIKSLTNEI